MRLINAYNVQPGDIKDEDVMLFVVKALVVRPGVYRLYRCVAKENIFEIPEGSRIVNEQEVCQALFPSLSMVAEPDGT